MDKFSGMYEYPESEYVRYADHKQAIATARAEALREAAERYRKSCCPLLKLKRKRYKAPESCSDCKDGRVAGYCTVVDAILADKQEGR